MKKSHRNLHYRCVTKTASGYDGFDGVVNTVMLGLEAASA